MCYKYVRDDLYSSIYSGCGLQASIAHVHMQYIHNNYIIIYIYIVGVVFRLLYVGDDL